MNQKVNILKAVQDPERLRVLRNLGLLDTEAEAAFDRLTHLASRITNTPVALISLVDNDRQFFKSLLGLPKEFNERPETPLSHSFCKHVVANKHPLIVSNAPENPEVKDNQAIKSLDVIAYLGFPLTTNDGVTLGSMCVIDHKPREWTEEEIEAVREVAQLTMTEIELRAQIKARREAETSRDNLMNMVIHDLRNPLSVIRASLELLELTIQNPTLGDRNAEVIEQSSLAAHELNGLIDDLLHLSKLEAGSFAPRFDQVNIEQFIVQREKLYQLRASIEQKGFTMRFAPNLPFVMLDKKLINRVLDNLIGNAIKYSNEECAVRLSVEQQNEMLQITITDHGMGIPDQFQEKIFEKFVQLTDKNGRPLRKGSGIGLAYCKEAVEIHNGRIWVESDGKKGSRFHFTLPINPNV